jgi:chemotaxis protein CheC
LSQLVGKAISLTNPTLEVIPLRDVPRALGGPERLVGAVYSRLLGDLAGGILFMAQRDSSLALVDLMHGWRVGTSKSFGHEEEQLLTHVVSVLSSAYLAAVARMADLSVLPGTPSFVLDMAGAILQVVTAELSMKAESAVLVRTTFTDEETSVDVALFFLPDPDSLQTILARVGVI